MYLNTWLQNIKVHHTYLDLDQARSRSRSSSSTSDWNAQSSDYCAVYLRSLVLDLDLEIYKVYSKYNTCNYLAKPV